MSACTACGSTLSPGSEFCPVCAAPVPAPSPTALTVAPPPAADVTDTVAERAPEALPAVRPEPADAGRRESWWRRLTGPRGRDEAAALEALPPPVGPPVALPAPQPPTAQPRTAQPPAAALAGAVEISPGSGPIIAAVPGFTRPEEPEPEREPEPVVELISVAEAPPADDVDRTRLASPDPAAPPVLGLPGGERLTVTGPGVLGRDPAAVVGQEVAHVVPIPDPTRSVSKTHLGFGIDAVGLWVKDLHSTNGTAVRSPEGVRTSLQPGLAVHVAPGDVVVVGDVELEVAR